jgi:hypothetical protein
LFLETVAFDLKTVVELSVNGASQDNGGDIFAGDRRRTEELWCAPWL